MNNWRALSNVLVPVIVLLCARATGAAPDSNVRDFGATGDGKTLDTIAMNKAIEACATSGGGRVVVPPGRYLTGTVRLRSNVTLEIESGAEVVGTPELDRYENFAPPKDVKLPEARWHRAVLMGDGVTNVTITGRGVINGNNVTDREGEEGIRGPHAVLFGNSRGVTVRDVSIKDAGNYALLLEFTNQIEVRGVKITGGYDGVHLRGWVGRPCRDVSITDCEFYTGDDCVAGWYWQDVVIDRCVMNSASNGIRLFGPAKTVIVHDCLMFGPGKYEWRTSGPLRHRNMAAALCIQPSAWGQTPGTVDDVHVSNVTMHDVGTPLHLANKAPSTIGTVTFDRLTATGVYRAAASIESWSDKPIGRVDVRDSSIQFVGGFGPILQDPAEALAAILTAQAGPDVNPPGENPRPLPAWGLYVRNVARLALSDVKFSVDEDEARPAVIMDGVGKLDVDGLRLPKGMRQSVVLKHVKVVAVENAPSIPVAEPK